MAMSDSEFTALLLFSLCFLGIVGMVVFVIVVGT